MLLLNTFLQVSPLTILETAQAAKMMAAIQLYTDNIRS